MSGIVGIYHVDGKTVDLSDVRRMTERLAHRGPDGSDTWHSGPIGLGHRMLWTTPESLHERLPLVSDDGHRALTADARIDNRDELITTLNITTPPERLVDSALILHAYERWGESCPEHLIGDFAFAIWDDEKQHLFCARDHMGVKPFYYYCSDELFTFASEIKALFCLPEVPRELNEAIVACYLTESCDDRTVTSYRNVLCLPAAHAITITQKEVTLRPYWSLDPTREIRFNTDEEYERAFRELFTEAVRCRLRSAFTVGAELSGGLDSSSIVCVARELLQQEGDVSRLHTFSAIFDEVQEVDERHYIHAVLAGGNLEPHYVHPDQLSLFTEVARRFWHVEEVYGLTPTSITYWKIYEAAKDSGLRVLLSGEWGDVVVSHGAGSLADLALRGNWLTVLRELAALSKFYGESKREVLFYQVVLPLVPRGARRVWRRIRHRRPYVRVPSFRLVSADFAKRTELAKRIEAHAGAAEGRPRSSRESHYNNLTELSIQNGLETVDKEAACFSLELRHPFLDRRVIEFCLALPPGQKIRRGYPRAIVRHALAHLLPAEVQWRVTKAVANPYIEHALLTFDRERVKDVLFTNSDVLEPYADSSALREMCHQLAHGDYRKLRSIWHAIVLGLWLRETGFASGGDTKRT